MMQVEGAVVRGGLRELREAAGYWGLHAAEAEPPQDLGGNPPCPHLDLCPVAFILDSGPPQLAENKYVLF